MFRRFFLLLAGVALAACTNPNDLDDAPVYLGDFHLGHNVVVAPNLTKGPASREASEEEWIASLTEAVNARFSRYDGTRLYHLGISVEGYVLAVPGIPLVASPKSALIVNVTVWDDAVQQKLNDKPETVTVVESISGNTILGSGVTQSKEVQMANLSRNAAKLIQNWLVRQNDAEGWFETDGVPANDKPAWEKQQDPAATSEADEAEDTAEQDDTANAATQAQDTSRAPQVAAPAG